MPNIKPISELRNYTSVVNEVKYGSRVYLTKNGHGQIAMIDMQELDEMEKELALYRFRLEMEKGERSILEEGTVSSDDMLGKGRKMQAFRNLDAARIEISQYLPDDFDPEKELEEARVERYAGVG